MASWNSGNWAGMGAEALSALYSGMSRKSSAKAENDAARKRIANAHMSLNLNIARYEHARTAAFDSALKDIEALKKQSQRLGGQVKAAVSEDIGEGVSARRIERDIKMDEKMAERSSKEEYIGKSRETDMNIDREIAETGARIRGIALQRVPSLLSTVGSTLIQGYLAEQNRAVQRESEEYVINKTGENTKLRGINPYVNHIAPNSTVAFTTTQSVNSNNTYDRERSIPKIYEFETFDVNKLVSDKDVVRREMFGLGDYGLQGYDYISKPIKVGVNK